MQFRVSMCSWVKVSAMALEGVSTGILSNGEFQSPAIAGSLPLCRDVPEAKEGLCSG